MIQTAHLHRSWTFAYLLPALAILLTVLLGASPARAQCPTGWVPGQGGTDSRISALVVLPGGDVIAGGSFTTAGGVSANNIARFNPSTRTWSSIGSGLNGPVYALAVLPGGDVIVGGQFVTAGGVPANRIARLSPSSNTYQALGSGVGSSIVYALAVLPDGDVIVGGQFTTAGGVSGRNNIARVNPTTGDWSTMGSGMGGNVFALAVLPASVGGDVVLGGNFVNAGGVSASRIARYNPTAGTWSAMGAGANGTVNALAVRLDGDVIIGGEFTIAGGISARRVSRYNPTSGTFSSFGLGLDNTVHALTLLPNNDIIVGGFFTTAGTLPASNIARLNPTTGDWSALSTGVDNRLFALATLPSGDMIAGGDFLNAGGIPSPSFALHAFSTPAPTIIAHPLPVVTTASNNAVFYCGAVPGFVIFPNPTYQWHKNGEPIDTLTNPSAATAGLSLTNVQSSDLGSYTCLVTNACGGPSALSNPATLTFAEAPPECPADFNDDGGIDGSDIEAFFLRWENGC